MTLDAKKIKHERDLEELRKAALALVAENNLLRNRLQNRDTALAEVLGMTQAEMLLDEDKKTSSKANLNNQGKWSKGSQRRPKNRRLDNKKKKDKPEVDKDSMRREAVQLELDEPDQVCGCGDALVRRPSLDETSKLVTFEHTILVTYDITRAAYGCKTCGHIERALPHEDQFRKGGKFGVSLVVQMLVFKYWQAMPLHRQVEFFAGAGEDITTQTMWDNVWAATTLLGPVYEAILADARTASVANVDETTWNLQKAKGKQWVWTMATERSVVYMIRNGRSHEYAEELLGDFGGVLVTDAMSAYQTFLDKRNTAIAQCTLENTRPPPKIIRAGCWSHARSYWIDAEDAFPTAVKPILDAIGELFAIDTDYRNGALSDDIALVKLTKSVDHIEELIDALVVMKNTSISRAKTYSQNQRKLLRAFLTHREIPLTNNFAERALRRCVLGRKAFYGSKSPRGSRAAEVFYTILSTCALLKVQPKKYLDAAIRAAKIGQVLTPHQFMLSGG